MQGVQKSTGCPVGFLFNAYNVRSAGKRLKRAFIIYAREGKTNVRKNSVETQPIERISPDPKVGLSLDEVALRHRQGAVNYAKAKEKSALRILRENFFSFFHCVLYVLALFFIAFMVYLNLSGHEDLYEEFFGPSKLVFLLPVLGSGVIGSIQMIRSQRLLRQMNIVAETHATVIRDGKKVSIPTHEIVLDDVLLFSAGEQAPVDLRLIDGRITVDESIITGESDPIVKKAGEMVLSGSVVFAGECHAQADKIGKDTYASRLAERVEGMGGHKSVLMENIYRIINAMAVVLLIVVATTIITLIVKVTHHPEILPVITAEAEGRPLGLGDIATWAMIFNAAASFAVGVIPTSLVLLASVALAASIVKLAHSNTLIRGLYSLESLARANVLCFDKTGTLTDGTMRLFEQRLHVDENEFREAMTSILGVFETTNLTSKALVEYFGRKSGVEYEALYPFSSETKYSGYLSRDGSIYLLGAASRLCQDPEELEFIRKHEEAGRRVLAVRRNAEVLGIVVLEEGLRASSKEMLQYYYDNGMDVKIISGDSPTTISRIALSSGVRGAEKAISLEGVDPGKYDDLVEEYTIFARVSPEDKSKLIDALQRHGKNVAMVGDGVNDVLALRKADVAVSFATACDSAKSCADVVLLDDDFSHMKEVIGEGRRTVSNIRRSCVFFLMENFAVTALCFLLIIFPKGQLLYSLENVALFEACMQAIGGLVLALEPRKEPIKGSFIRTVFGRAVPAAVFLLLSLLLPILFLYTGAYGDYQSAYAQENCVALMSVLAFITGVMITAVNSWPFNRYRLIAVLSMLGFGLLLIFFMPHVFVGGDPLNGSNFAVVMATETFQPWNAPALRCLFFTAEGNFNAPSVTILVLFTLGVGPAYSLFLKGVDHVY